MKEEWVDRLIAYQARKGNDQWLIDALDYGDGLGPLTRGFLIDSLRGEIKKPKGNKRTFAQMGRDMTVLLSVITSMCDHQITEYAAVMLLVEDGENLDTTRSALKRAKKDLPDFWPIELNGKLVVPWSVS
jgi:hypothetical protein